MPDPRDAAFYQTIVREQEARLATCAKTRSCDLVHFTLALVALYKNREMAARHFQEVVSAAPNSRLGSSSLLWLRLLRNPTRGEGQDRLYAQTAEQLVRDLLEMESSLVLPLQRELKARDRKLADLSKQLEALKRVDQEMKEREKARPKRLPNSSDPAADKEPKP